MPFNSNSTLTQDIERLINRAITANRRAKESDAQTREAFYRIKNAAINALLIAGCAFVDGVDWSAADATIGVRFVDGRALHTKQSELTLSAFRKVRELIGACESAGRITVVGARWILRPSVE
jgi:hypothetical protein